MGVGSFLKTVGKVAYPMLTTAASAGGPFGVMAAQQIGKALGLDKAPDGTDAIEAAMAKASGDPQTQITLAKAEQDFKLQVETLTNGKIKNAQDFEAHLAEVDAADRANARDRETKVKDSTPHVIAYLTLALAIIATFFIGFMCYRGAASAVNAAMLALLSSIVGYIFRDVAQVNNYYFGSSAGSERKTELLAQAPAVGE